MAVNNYSVYDMFAQIKERAERGKTQNAGFKRLARNLKTLPLVLVDAKDVLGSFDEETESVYLGNGTRKTQIETVPIVYSSYSSSVFRNQ
jgi:hypothetical protein